VIQFIQGITTQKVCTRSGGGRVWGIKRDDTRYRVVM
jgi:hypothetical protein